MAELACTLLRCALPTKGAVWGQQGVGFHELCGVSPGQHSAATACPCVCWQLHQKWPRPNGGPSNCAVALDGLLVPHCSAMGWWILDALLAPWWWATHNGAMEHVAE